MLDCAMRKGLWALPLFLAVLLAAVLPLGEQQGATAGTPTPSPSPTLSAPTPLVVTREDDPSPNGCAPADCSLREAILALTPGQTIAFDIPGSGIHTIKPTSPLPSIMQNGATVDGYTQTDSHANTADAFHAGNAAIKIV